MLHQRCKTLVFFSVFIACAVLCSLAVQAGFTIMATKCQILIELVLIETPNKAWSRYLVYPMRYALS